MERWADARVVAALPGAFAHYDAEDVRSALFATMELFRWVSRETAERLGLPNPPPAEERARDWVARCYAEREATIGLKANGTRRGSGSATVKEPA